MARSGPSQGFSVRDGHRTALTAHFIALAAGLGAAFIANRFLTPGVLWAQWVALGWGLAFAAHLVVFARATLGSMTPRGR